MSSARNPGDEKQEPKKIRLSTKKRSRYFYKDGEKIGSQSQESSLSPFENSQSPTNRGSSIKRSLSAVPAAFFSRQNNAAQDEKDEKDEKAEAIHDDKRRKTSTTLTIARDPAAEKVKQIHLAKQTFLAALAEFYQQEEIKSFDQRQLAAALACWFAEACERPDILSFAKASPIADKNKRAKENKAYNLFLGFLIMQGYGIATALRPDKVQAKFETYMHKHLNVYTFKAAMGKFEEPYHSYTKNLKAKLKAKANLEYEHSGMVPHLQALDKVILKKIAAALPQDFKNNEQQFVNSFFEEKLNRIEGYFHLRSPQFIVCLLHELGEMIAKQKGTSKDMQKLGNIFKSRAAVLGSEFQADTNSQTNTAGSSYDSSSSPSSSSSSDYSRAYRP